MRWNPSALPIFVNQGLAPSTNLSQPFPPWHWQWCEPPDPLQVSPRDFAPPPGRGPNQQKHRNLWDFGECLKQRRKDINKVLKHKKIVFSVLFWGGSLKSSPFEKGRSTQLFSSSAFFFWNQPSILGAKNSDDLFIWFFNTKHTAATVRPSVLRFFTLWRSLHRCNPT